MKKMGKSIVLSTGLLLVSPNFSPIPWNVPVVEAASAVKIVPTVYQTTANLNMRTGAGTKYKIVLTIPKGKTVKATEKLGDWYKVSYEYSEKGKKYTKTGWVSGSYLKKVSSQPATGGTTKTTAVASTVYQTTANLNMRTGAGTKYKIVLTIPKGKTVKATEKLGDWYKVSYEYSEKGKKYTKTGWVSGSYLKKVSSQPTTGNTSQPDKGNTAKPTVITKTVYQTTANLNMRTGAGTKYKIVLTIPKGKTVKATEKLGDWYKVSYEYSEKGKKYTKTGWVSGSYLKKVSSQPTTGNTSQPDKGNTAKPTVITKTVYQTTANLNMRTGAGTTYKTVITIPKGKNVTATEKLGDWYKVSYEYSEKGKKYTKTGWVSGSYLSEYNQYKNISGTYFFTKKASFLYSVPKQQGSTVKLTDGNGLYSTRMVINSIGQTWYEVTFNGKKLYVSANDVTKVAPQQFSETKYQVKNDAALYAAPGSAHNRLMTIPKGTVVSSSLNIGSWYEVTYKGKKGYVHSAELAKYAPAPSSGSSNPAPGQSAQPNNPSSSTITETGMSGRTFAVRANLNVRKQPSTSADLLATIPKGTIVVPTHRTSNGWYKLKYAGKTGYVSGDYITEVKTGAPLDGQRDGYQFIDLRTQAPVEAGQINKYIQSYVQSTGKQSVLVNQGQTFINVGRKYGVNPLYLAAHAIHESAFGTSRLALTKYNLFGYGAYDAAPFVSAYRFSSIEESIEYVARKIKSSYLNPSHPFFKGAFLGFRTNTLQNIRVDESSEGMNFYYATDPYWGQTIARHMANMLSYDSNYYKSARIDTSVPSSPSVPSGSDQFPAGIVAVANSSIPLYDKKAGKQIATLAKGSTFTLLEKTNDYWIKLNYNGTQYWTNAIKLYDYRTYMTVKNLGSVTATALNVREKPQGNIISQLKLGQYVQLKLTKDGKLEMNGSWYKVVLANGTEGWVSSQYIIRELQ
ncbi:SH3 domain-containing protein [Geobacillus thermodenitrificans]|uniref:SH3 domain-containing protein n=1 Tax=Geobacillus thermodenitrificans TaxID=33940 RepID=UPI002E1EE679|nr:SH3 domain-containing protein [Geobacillus thermodenitrificans]